MLEKTYTYSTADDLSGKILALQNTDGEISFAVNFENNESGALIESSIKDWWGAKFSGAFDGTFLIFGEIGGGDWFAYDATTTLLHEEIYEIVRQVLKAIGAGLFVCVNVEPNKGSE